MCGTIVVAVSRVPPWNKGTVPRFYRLVHSFQQISQLLVQMVVSCNAGRNPRISYFLIFDIEYSQILFSRAKTLYAYIKFLRLTNGFVDRWLIVFDKETLNYGIGRRGFDYEPILVWERLPLFLFLEKLLLLLFIILSEDCDRARP